MKNTELEQLINEKLNSAAISDYAPNGLQVEGKETVQKNCYRCHRQPGLCSMRQCVWARMRSLCIMATSERRVSGHSRNEA